MRRIAMVLRAFRYHMNFSEECVTVLRQLSRCVRVGVGVDVGVLNLPHYLPTREFN